MPTGGGTNGIGVLVVVGEWESHLQGKAGQKYEFTWRNAEVCEMLLVTPTNI